MLQFYRSRAVYHGHSLLMDCSSWPNSVCVTPWHCIPNGMSLQFLPRDFGLPRFFRDFIIFAPGLSIEFLAFAPRDACGVFCRQEHCVAVERPRDTYRGVIEHKRAFGIGAIVVVDLVAETRRV